MPIDNADALVEGTELHKAIEMYTRVTAKLLSANEGEMQAKGEIAMLSIQHVAQLQNFARNLRRMIIVDILNLAPREKIEEAVWDALAFGIIIGRESKEPEV